MERKNKILISIITVCYNSEKTIRDTIESVLNQSYDNIEYILIDGKSTDNTVEIIKSYKEEAKEKGITYKWVSEEDRGIYDAMNKGIEMVSGELVGIINSDDWYKESTVKIVVREYLKTNADLIHGDMFFLTPTTKKLYTPRKYRLKYWLLKYKMIINHPTCFVKKSIYEELGSFNLNFKIIADYNFVQNIYFEQKKILYIREILAYMRDGGVSSLEKRKAIEEVYKLNKKINKVYFFMWKIYQNFKMKII